MLSFLLRPADRETNLPPKKLPQRKIPRIERSAINVRDPMTRSGTFLAVIRADHTLRRTHAYSEDSRSKDVVPAQEQPPAAARAERFAAKNAPAGQRQIKDILGRSVRAGLSNDDFPCASLRQRLRQRRLREVRGQRALKRSIVSKFSLLGNREQHVSSSEPKQKCNPTAATKFSCFLLKASGKRVRRRMWKRLIALRRLMYLVDTRSCLRVSTHNLLLAGSGSGER
jgi:hypothetical protein